MILIELAPVRAWEECYYEEEEYYWVYFVKPCK